MARVRQVESGFSTLDSIQGAEDLVPMKAGCDRSPYKGCAGFPSQVTPLSPWLCFLLPFTTPSLADLGWGPGCPWQDG